MTDNGTPMAEETENEKTVVDEDIENGLIALRRAAKAAQERAKRHGHGVIIHKDGQVVEWFPGTDIYKAVKRQISAPPDERRNRRVTPKCD